MLIESCPHVKAGSARDLACRRAGIWSTSRRAPMRLSGATRSVNPGDEFAGVERSVSDDERHRDRFGDRWL